MKSILASALFFILIFLNNSTIARTVSLFEGVVVLYPAGCNYFVVSTTTLESTSFAILKWESGTMPAEGDIVLGNFESKELELFRNTTTGYNFRGFIRGFNLSTKEAAAKYSRYLNVCLSNSEKVFAGQRVHPFALFFYSEIVKLTRT